MSNAILASKMVTMQTSVLKRQKLVTISATSTLMTDKKTEEELEQIPCIWYLITFKDQTKTLLDSGSEVSTMSKAFVQQLRLKICKTNAGAQKIDSTTLETYEIVVSTISVLDKDGKERFIEESVLLADIRPDIVLGIPFLTISNADIDFQAQDLQWRFYTTGDVLPTPRQVELRGKKDFAAGALDSEHKVFVVYVVTLSIDSGDEVHPLRRAQIAHLKADEAFSEVPSKYADFVDVFFPKLAAKLSEHTEINDHAIELVDD